MDTLRLNRLLGPGLGCVLRVELGRARKAVHHLCPRKAVAKPRMDNGSRKWDIYDKMISMALLTRDATNAATSTTRTKLKNR